ncbi:MAG: hypothetical protein KDI00_00395 [Pseudomonadales bacterium]|nr:hypothetical protein [Pseudomonadales bacterium]
MTNNFRWFLRFIIYIPLTIALFFTLGYSYFNSRFEQNFSECLAQTPISATNKSAREVDAFVGCLKKKGNFFISNIMHEERLYQYAKPKIQCDFVGKWHVSEGYKEYWLTIEPDSRFFVEPMMMARSEQKNTIEKTGIWSSVNKNTAIQFFDGEYFWPINEYKIEWLSDKHFLMTNPLQEKQAFFFRHTPINKDCQETATK